MVNFHGFLDFHGFSISIVDFARTSSTEFQLDNDLAIFEPPLYHTATKLNDVSCTLMQIAPPSTSQRQEAFRIHGRQGTEFHLLGRGLGMKCWLIMVDICWYSSMGRPIIVSNQTTQHSPALAFSIYQYVSWFLSRPACKGICKLATSPWWSGVTGRIFATILVAFRAGDVFLPLLAETLLLAVCLHHFASCRFKICSLHTICSIWQLSLNLHEFAAFGAKFFHLIPVTHVFLQFRPWISHCWGIMHVAAGTFIWKHIGKRCLLPVL